MEQNLDDIEQIKQLKAKYVRLGDTKQWAPFAELFHEDVEMIFEVMPRASKDHPTSAVVKGRDQFIGAMDQMLKGVVTTHQAMLPEITLTGPNTATGIWAMHDYVHMGTCIFQGWGHYHEDYVKVGGRWKIIRSRTTRLRTQEEWL